MLCAVLYTPFLEAMPVLAIELPPDIKEFLDWLIPNNLEAIAWLTGNIESGGIYNGTITHGDFRLENLFFEQEGKNGAPKKAAFIDFQIMHCGGMSLQA